LTEDCQHRSSQFFNNSPKKERKQKSNTHNFDLPLNTRSSVYTRWLVVYLFNGHVQLEIHDLNEKKKKKEQNKRQKMATEFACSLSQECAMPSNRAQLYNNCISSPTSIGM
jgi:gamma-glutamylcysteine synthetase